MTSKKSTQQKEQELSMALQPVVMESLAALGMEIPGLDIVQMAGMVIDSLDPYGYNNYIDRDTLNNTVSNNISQINDKLASAGQFMSPDNLNANLPKELLPVYNQLSDDAQNNLMLSATQWGNVQTPYDLNLQFCFDLGQGSKDNLMSGGIFPILSVIGGNNASVSVSGDLSKTFTSGTSFKIQGTVFDGYFISNGAVYNSSTNQTTIPVISIPQNASLPASIIIRLPLIQVNGNTANGQNIYNPPQQATIVVAGDFTQFLKSGTSFTLSGSASATYTSLGSTFDGTNTTITVSSIIASAKLPINLQFNLNILSVNASQELLTIPGDFTSVFPSGRYISIVNSNFNGPYVLGSSNYDSSTNQTVLNILSIPTGATVSNTSAIVYGCTDDIYKNAYIDFYNKNYDAYNNAPINNLPNTASNIFNIVETQQINDQTATYNSKTTKLGILLGIGYAVLLGFILYIIWHFSS